MTNRSRAFWAGTALVTSLAMSTAVYAQETTSAVRGTVATADGSPISGASVRVVHEPSGTTTTTLTGSDGVFDARGLRVGGPYTVTVAADGYSADSLDGVIIGAGDTLRLNFDLESASAVDDIVVIGARDVTANNTGVSSTLDADDIAGVVSVNRDIRDLARRNILVASDPRGFGGVSIAGSNPRTNRVSIDGLSAQDEFGLNSGGLPTRRGPVSLDAIEQFSVSAVPIDVENGDFNGGALDVVLKSGGNDFRGTAFVNYLNDGLVGDSIRGVNLPSQITQNNYGFFFSGPLWEDRLFFASSYELYESVNQTTTGPVGAGYANDIRGITQANIDSFISLFNTAYAADFETGNIDRTKPVTDEKYTVKLDWNITDNHRLSATYRNAESSLVVNRTGLSTSQAALSSQWYVTGEFDEAYALELNSNWTNSLSTQLRYSERNYTRLQDPPSGQEFADVQVCSSPTSINSGGDNLFSCGTLSNYRFGPDLNRHANFLETTNKTLLAKAEYAFGDNLFKVGFQGQEISVFNIFVPSSDGVYYFDSLADFQAGRANSLTYTNAITGNANDAAAVFTYRLNTVFAQNTLELTPTLTLQAGVRYDWYQSDDKPALNNNFVSRNGFNNQTTYDGIDILMPRASFEWDATDWLTINGGLGLFSGGLPDVLLSNSFSNTGVLTSGVVIRRTATGFEETTNTPGFTPAIGAAALNLNLADPRTFYDIPTAVQTFQGGAVASPTANVNALVPSFELPSDWRYFLNAAVELPEGWASAFLPDYATSAFDNWRLSFDAVFTQTNKSVVFRDTRAQRLLVNGVAQLTPDGRARYDGVAGTAVQRAAFGITSTNNGSGTDIVAFNGSEGESYTLGVSASRSFDNGWDVLLGYAFQNAEDETASLRNGTTAGGLYGNGVSRLDPNREDFGRSYDEIENRFKTEIGYRHNFFGDYETRFNLFGEIRDGRPLSFTMTDPSGGRSPTFGVSRGGQLLYVPDFANDANPNDLQVGTVFFDTAATRDRFRTLVDTFGLPYGQIVQKGEGSDDQPEIYQVDLQFSQELPVAFLPGRLRFTADVQNLANLLNDEWGIIEEYGSVDGQNVTLISAQCADAAGVVAAAGNPICASYRYTNPSASADTINRDADGKSLWAIQLGLRYSF